MNLLIFGGGGLVGTALGHGLATMGHQVRTLTRSEFDIATDHLAPEVLDNIDCAINAAIVKDLDDTPAATSKRVNIEFPHELCRLCNDHGVAMIHISSDGVFRSSGGPHYEDDRPTAEDAYGQQKIASEPNDCLVIRTSVIGPEQTRFSGLLCWLLQQNESCQGYTNHLWNGVTSLELAHAIHNLLCAELAQPGVRHIFANEMSKYRLLQLLADAFEHKIEIEPVEAPNPRDQRLGTRYRDFLQACNIRLLERQIAELPKYVDARGHWR